jgi:hypothetical protein
MLTLRNRLVICVAVAAIPGNAEILTRSATLRDEHRVPAGNTRGTFTTGSLAFPTRFRRSRSMRRPSNFYTDGLSAPACSVT